MAKKRSEIQPVEIKQFQSVQEIDRGIAKLERRIKELEELNIIDTYRQNTGAKEVVTSNIRETILEVFGANSPENREHQHLRLWAGQISFNMSEGKCIESEERGRIQTIGIIRGLINRLKEKRDDMAASSGATPTSYFDQLKLHPRIVAVSRDRFMDGYPWDAVFAGAKALINYVKECSGRHDLDGAPLMRTVFSRNDPVLAFNDLSDPTDFEEQEGMMHLFEGAVLGIRNPGGHTFPEGPEQRAIEYISLLSLLAYRVQEAKRRKSP